MLGQGDGAADAKVRRGGREEEGRRPVQAALSFLASNRRGPEKVLFEGQGWAQKERGAWVERAKEGERKWQRAIVWAGLK